MTIEYLGAKIFLQEILAAGEIWVARGQYKNIHAQEIENYAYSLPAWSSRARAEGFLRISRMAGRFEPRAIPLDEFAGRWLSDQSLAIAEVQVNPLGTESRILALTAEEFQSKVGAH